MSNEIKNKVEEIKQDADVQRALKQATPKKKEKTPATRIRDKLVIGTHVLLLIGLFVVHQILSLRFPAFYEQYPIARKLIAAVAVSVVCLMVLRLVEVYFIGRVANTVHKYNLNRVLRLVVWLIIAFLRLNDPFSELVHGRCLIRFDLAGARVCIADADHELHWLDLHPGS